MDQIKIGKFIAELRKSNNMTQSELAEKLGVSNKSVSRWETGKNMPDVSMFIPLCELLGISVNEFIIGERIEENDMKKKDEALIETIDKSNKKISKARIILFISAVLFECAGLFLLPLTAQPGDEMGVVILSVLLTILTAVFVSLLDISLSKKFIVIPVSLLIFIPASLIFSDDFFDYTLPYIAIIGGFQFVTIIIINSIIFIAKKTIAKLKTKRNSK